MKIYIDVDDTLADFREYAVERGVPRWEGSWYTTDPATWTQEQKDIQAATNALMERDDFWSNIPVAPGAHELVSMAALNSHAGDVKLLTALPSSIKDPAKLESIRAQKLEWAQRMLHFPARNVIICERRHKLIYATEGARMTPNLLIDDAEQTCIEWGKAGGRVIYHRDMPSSIRKLRAYFAPIYAS